MTLDAQLDEAAPEPLIFQRHAAGLAIDIEIADTRWTNTLSDLGVSSVDDPICQVINAAMKLGELAVLPGTEVAILLTNDAAIQKLNADFRDLDKPTDVLSFPQHPDTFRGVRGPALGDIVIAFETTSNDAHAASLSLEDHLTHLTVHGLLHLFGYDHIEEDEAHAMEELEVRVLAELGIANPYTVTAETP